MKPEGKPPSFISELLPSSATEDESFKLVCNVSGEPKPTITWFKNNKEIPLDNRVTTTFDGHVSTLSFNKVALDDAGNYKCQIKNEHGSVESSADVAVEKKKRIPEVIDGMKNVDSTEGGTAKFEVEITGYPSANVDWYHRKNKIKDSDKFTIEKLGDIHALNIKNVNLDDSGFYRCVARNEAGEVEVQAKLNVAEKEFAPEFEGEVPSQISLNENDELQVELKVAGKPKPEIVWLKDDVRLYDTSKLSLFSRGITNKLSIPIVKPSDAGRYRCEASNEHGSSKRSFNVTVEGMILYLTFI